MIPEDKLKVRRHPERGIYSPEEIHRILDDAFVCHIGFVDKGQPFVIPTVYGRSGDHLYIHGSSLSRMINTVGEGVDVCVTVTIVDGLVLARSAFDHSVNYRSVVILGKASLVSPEKKEAALRAISDHILPGRWEDVREPNAGELKSTGVLEIPLTKASAKIRSGPPKDQKGDYGRNVWAGILPLSMTAGDPVADNVDGKTVPLPEYLKRPFRK